MRRKILLLITGLVFSLSCSTANNLLFPPTPTPTSTPTYTPTFTATFTPTPQYDVAGTWKMLFDWDCNGGDQTSYWRLNRDGTFDTRAKINDDWKTGGTWFLDGNSFTLEFKNGTHYEGTVSPGSAYMEGTMVSKASTTMGDTGCWHADLIDN